MDVDYSSKYSKALDGIHGVKLVHQSLLRGHCEDLDISTSANYEKIQRSPNLIITQIWQQRPSFMRPIRCSIQGDQNIVETVVNVLTSVPFIILGLQAPRKNLNSVLYANSLIGVGVASSLYHSSRGQVRSFFRWADYTMIATATVCLSRALRSENPKLLMAASAMFLPFQPLMVSAVHTGMMESGDKDVNHAILKDCGNVIDATISKEQGSTKNKKKKKKKGKGKENTSSLPVTTQKEMMTETMPSGPQHSIVIQDESYHEESKVAFAKKALTKPELRTAHNLHAMSSLLGSILFIADDLFPETPYIHAAWHLAAAVGVGTCNKLLE